MLAYIVYDNLQPRKAFELGLVPPNAWNKWRQCIEFYCIAVDLDKAPVAKKRAPILGDFGLDFTANSNGKTTRFMKNISHKR